MLIDSISNTSVNIVNVLSLCQHDIIFTIYYLFNGFVSSMRYDWIRIVYLITKPISLI